MAEAEDVIVDAARHATAYAQQLWHRRRRANSSAPLELDDLAPRLTLLLTAVHGGHWSLRVAQAPPPVTTLTRLFLRQRRPWPALAVPFSDAASIWLPRRLDGTAPDVTPLLYRAMALQQAARSRQRPPELLVLLPDALQRDFYLVLEADAVDAALSRILPGLRDALRLLRDEARRRRPPLSQFAPRRLPLECWLRERSAAEADVSTSKVESLIESARTLADQWPHDPKAEPLLKDWWTGDWPPHEYAPPSAMVDVPFHAEGESPVRSARLRRRPRVRAAKEGEDDKSPGAFMVQSAQPHEHAEDPMGAQRPTDRDADGAAEAHAESVSDLAEARLVRSAQPAHEVLLSDDPPPTSPHAGVRLAEVAAVGIRYPEWDYRRQAYRDPGTTVWESVAAPGSRAWVERTLAAQRAMLGRIQRQFEMLRAQRITLHRQDEGDEIDIDACIEARADLRGGAALSQRLYQRTRVGRRDTAIVVLVDVSGSTDGWLAGQRRIIDVEREALLPLSIALDGLGEPHAILAFSGEGPQQVVVRSVKRFDECHGDAVALRIAGLEPERYTRAGAALRHASCLLAARPARHRLLLLLSDGKPNDQDEYDGRYGVEDTRQAVLEARHGGLSTFCLTVDRQAAAYLPRVFGPQHYALLQQPERLPVVLLDWMKRLLTG